MTFKMTKQQVANNLINQANEMVNDTDKRVREKGRNILRLAQLVENAQLENYEGLALTQNKNLNEGYIAEQIVLDFKKALKENEYLEVKYLGNNTPNILTNESVKLVYIIVNKVNCKGGFIIRNMKAIRNKRLTLNYLLDNDLLIPCDKLNEYLGLQA